MSAPKQSGERPIPCPPEVLTLVEHFDRNRDDYKSGQYNEAQLRQQFLNPLFEALGWDMANRAGYAEAYKEVIHEDAIKIGSETKAPDYCFRIGGTRKFFLEAKKPSVYIKEEIPPAFQLRRYAWSAKLPLSILCDFEEFAVYDTRIKPDRNDKASTARINYFTYKEYAEKWGEIVSVFSKDAVLTGSFDKYADTSRLKKGTATVDDAFLTEIEDWRDLLARNIAIRNPELSQRELNFAVQRTIDRIVFLRICEDRGIEEYGKLQALQNGTNSYKRLVQLFSQADDRYNSGLFHFQKEKDRHEEPDTLTTKIEIDDKPLKEIIKRLYYPDSPYEFSVLSADILGQVYEQFLGKVISLTAGHRAKVEEKPEVRKAGGVYYTPKYIVDYIVKNTVGTLLNGGDNATPPLNSPLAKGGHGGSRGLTPKEAAMLRILDPACGSGSFLLGAYQYLLDWHRDWYVNDDPKKWATNKNPTLYQAQGGDYRLTTAERKRILLNNIYGVDIDSQAVEVTKLSLLLKVLEGESNQTLANQLRMFHQRALPDLGDNIKCGNSLIGPDFYQQQTMLDDEARLRINVFDWEKEFFEIMKAGGFDVVIGNPPYVRQESLSEFKDYFASHYEAFDGVADLYAYMMERSVNLLREGGRFSFIVSSSFLRTTYGGPLRRTMKKNAAVLSIVDFGGLPVFANAKDTYVCIPLFTKSKQLARVEVTKISSLEFHDLNEYVTHNSFSIPHERLSPEAWALKSDEEAAAFDKVMKAGKPLGEYVERKMFYGLKTGYNEAFELTMSQRNAFVKGNRASESLIKPFLGGQDIRRYFVNNDGRYLIVIPSGWTRSEMLKAKKGTSQLSEREAWSWFGREHPKLANHLEGFVDACRKRQDQGEYWWELRSCDYYEYFDRPKIIFPDICKGPRFYLDRSGIYIANTAYCLGVDDPYLLGILNSRLFWFAISNISIPFGIRAGEYRYRLIYQYMEKVPVRVINASDKVDKARRDKIASLVDQMLSLNKQLPAAKTDQEKTALQRQIDATDRQIDQLVYELYGLTEEEIKIVQDN